MLAFVSFCVGLFACGALSAPWGHSPPPYNSWDLKDFKSFVVFGDSYTDENRLNYFGSHNGSAPPPGWVDPINPAAADGGYIWARYVNFYTGANLYDYAVSGAVCSNAISPRTWLSAINFDFPAVQEYEVPAFLADKAYIEPDGAPFLDVPADETVYAIWIGTNDVGNDAFLTDSQVPGKTLVDYVNCVYSALDRLYQAGGRYFVILNLAPLNLAPQYTLPSAGGLAATKFFPDKSIYQPNITETSYKMMEYVVTLNDVFAYQTPYEVVVARRYNGAHMAVFDVHSLMTNIYYNPAEYLNGTQPFNVTAAYDSCNVNGTDCVLGSDPDSYMWYDELHPSQQTERIIAREFVNVVSGNSTYATYWS